MLIVSLTGPEQVDVQHAANEEEKCARPAFTRCGGRFALQKATRGTRPVLSARVRQGEGRCLHQHSAERSAGPPCWLCAQVGLPGRKEHDRGSIALWHRMRASCALLGKACIGIRAAARPLARQDPVDSVDHSSFGVGAASAMHAAHASPHVPAPMLPAGMTSSTVTGCTLRSAAVPALMRMAGMQAAQTAPAFAAQARMNSMPSFASSGLNAAPMMSTDCASASASAVAADGESSVSSEGGSSGDATANSLDPLESMTRSSRCLGGD